MSEEKKDVILYKSNSHKSREESSQVPEKKVEKVISGDVKVRKKGFFGKLKDALFSSDDSKSVGSYVISDILVPSAKKVISDVVTTSIDMILYGESRHTSRTSTGSKISYQRYYENNNGSRERANRIGSGYEVKEIIVPTKGEAEMVLGTLDELLDSYGVATVSDYYDIVGVDDKYTDSYYGWTNLSDAKTRPVREGWVIIMPRATQIK